MIMLSLALPFQAASAAIEARLYSRAAQILSNVENDKAKHLFRKIAEKNRMAKNFDDACDYYVQGGFPHVRCCRRSQSLVFGFQLVSSL